MSTVQYNSTYLGYALNKSDTWNSGYAAQGAAKAGQPRDGLMLYSGLRNGSVSWPNQSVTEVRLYLDFGTAGASARKYIGLYASSRNSAGGVGSAVRGTYLGQFRTATTTYGAKETVTFNSGTNAEVFDALKNWIEYGSTYGLVMFMNETNSSSYTTNFLNVDGSNIQIDYVVKGSSGTVTPDPVDIGSDVTLDIDPVVVTGTLTHTVEFECGSVTSGVISLAEGVDQYTYTTPSTWIDELGGTSSGTATCTLTTYIDGVETGSRTISFTAQVPDAYAPVINSFAVARYSSYVDDYGVTQYKEDLEGGYVWVNMSAQMDTSSGLTPSLEINYWPLDDETDITNVPMAWTGTGTPSTMTLTDDRTIITAAVPIANGYVFELTFTNGNQTVTARSSVQKSWATFHVAGSGYGVGIGKFSGGTQAEPSFDVAWPTTFDGDVTVNGNLIANGSGDTGWISLERASGVNANQGPGFTGIAYRVINGNHVYVAAYIGLSSNWTASKTLNSEMIPAQYRPPSATVYRLCVVPGRYIGRAYVNTSGAINLEWVQNIASSSQTSSAAVGWTDIYIDYFIS